MITIKRNFDSFANTEKSGIKRNVLVNQRSTSVKKETIFFESIEKREAYPNLQSG